MSALGWGYQTLPLPTPTMSSVNLWSFCDGVRDEFEGFTRDLLGRVAHDYDLKESELVTRYLTSSAPQQSPVSQAMARALPPAPAAPVLVRQGDGFFRAGGEPHEVTKKRGRKPAPGIESLDLTRPLTDDQIGSLTIPTLKAVCKHHGLKVTGSRPELTVRIEGYQANPNDPLLKKKKGGRTKRVAGPKEPEHTHPVDDQIHDDCAQCQAYGNPLAPHQAQEEFEVSTAPAASPPASSTPTDPSAPAETKDFEMPVAVTPAEALQAVEEVGEIQPAEEPEEVHVAAGIISPVSPEEIRVDSPRSDLQLKLKNLLAASDSDDESDDEGEGEEARRDYGSEEELECEGYASD